MRKLSFLIIVIVVFAIGWLSATVYSFYDINLFPDSTSGGKKFTEPFLGILGLDSKEIASPANRVDESQIAVYPDRVLFYIDDPQWTGFYDTNSMDPVLDIEADGIEIMPESPLDIQIGDVISYIAADGTNIVHRVVDIGEDSNGFYYIMKGDNNPLKDSEKVRFHQITGILVAVFY